MCGPGSSHGQWSPIAVVAALLLNVGTLMFIIAFASKQWITSNEDRLDELEFGLFKACFLDLSEKSLVEGQNIKAEKKCQSPVDFVGDAWGSDWVPGVQCIFIFSLITAIMATAIMDFFLVLPVDNLRRKPGPPFVVLCFNIASFTLGFTGGIILVLRQLNSSTFDSTKLDWAFRLTMAAKTLFLISLMLLFVEYHRLLTEAVDRRRMRNSASNAGYELTNMNGSPAQRGAHSTAGARARPSLAASDYPRAPPVSEKRGIDNRGMVDDEPPQGAAALPLEPRDEMSVTGLRRERMKYY